MDESLKVYRTADCWRLRFLKSPLWSESLQRERSNLLFSSLNSRSAISSVLVNLGPPLVTGVHNRCIPHLKSHSSHLLIGFPSSDHQDGFLFSVAWATWLSSSTANKDSASQTPPGEVHVTQPSSHSQLPVLSRGFCAHISIQGGKGGPLH